MVIHQSPTTLCIRASTPAGLRVGTDLTGPTTKHVLVQTVLSGLFKLDPETYVNRVPSGRLESDASSLDCFIRGA